MSQTSNEEKDSTLDDPIIEQTQRILSKNAKKRGRPKLKSKLELNRIKQFQLREVPVPVHTAWKRAAVKYGISMEQFALAAIKVALKDVSRSEAEKAERSSRVRDGQGRIRDFDQGRIRDFDVDVDPDNLNIDIDDEE